VLSTQRAASERLEAILSKTPDSSPDCLAARMISERSSNSQMVSSDRFQGQAQYHSAMQAAPETVEEVRRILLEHSAASACPLPAD